MKQVFKTKNYKQFKLLPEGLNRLVTKTSLNSVRDSLKEHGNQMYLDPIIVCRDWDNPDSSYLLSLSGQNRIVVWEEENEEISYRIHPCKSAEEAKEIIRVLNFMNRKKWTIEDYLFVENHKGSRVAQIIQTFYDNCFLNDKKSTNLRKVYKSEAPSLRSFVTILLNSNFTGGRLNEQIAKYGLTNRFLKYLSPTHQAIELIPTLVFDEVVDADKKFKGKFLSLIVKIIDIYGKDKEIMAGVKALTWYPTQDREKVLDYMIANNINIDRDKLSTKGNA